MNGITRGGEGSSPGSRRASPQIDPAQIPRPRTMSSTGAEDSAEEGSIFETRVNGKHALPPPTATNIVYATSWPNGLSLPCAEANVR